MSTWLVAGPLCELLAQKRQVLAILEHLAALVLVVRPDGDLFRPCVVVVGANTVDGGHTVSMSATENNAGAVVLDAKFMPSK